MVRGRTTGTGPGATEAIVCSNSQWRRILSNLGFVGDTRPLDEHRPAVAVIGGGASGVLVAVHFLAGPAADPARFLIFEHSGKVGSGAAFSSPHHSHVLNVPAGGISTFKEDPGHFARWLDRKGHLGGPDDFVPLAVPQLPPRHAPAAAGSNQAGHVLNIIRIGSRY